MSSKYSYSTRYTCQAVIPAARRDLAGRRPPTPVPVPLRPCRPRPPAPRRLQCSAAPPPARAAGPAEAEPPLGRLVLLVAADGLGRRHSGLPLDERGHPGPAEGALAEAHPGAGAPLQRVDAARRHPAPQRVEDLPLAHLLAAADDALRPAGLQQPGDLLRGSDLGTMMGGRKGRKPGSSRQLQAGVRQQVADALGDGRRGGEPRRVDAGRVEEARAPAPRRSRSPRCPGWRGRPRRW